MKPFQWKVAKDGYEWAPGEGTDELLLKPVTAWNCKDSTPLKDTGLFRMFAETRTTPEGVLAFATANGLLGFNWKAFAVPADGDQTSQDATESPGSTRPLPPERLQDWHEQIVLMRESVNCWDRKGGADDQSMDKLRKCVSDQLQGRVGVVFDRTGEVDSGFILRMLPINLLGALWLQLAEAISGNKELRPCVVCRKWMDISQHRTTKHYCSDRCRSQTYRNRKKKARTLNKNGKPPKEIAEELGVGLKTVKTWLKEKK